MSIDWNKAIPPKWINGTTVVDLGIDKLPFLTIKAVCIEAVGMEQVDKPVVRLDEVPQGLIVAGRRTCDALRDLCGEDSDQWPGQRIRITRNPKADRKGEPGVLILPPLTTVPRRDADGQPDDGDVPF